MNLPELIEWLSKRAVAPNLAIYCDGFRQCVEALKSIQPLRDRVKVLEDQLRKAKNVMDGCLTYDPMVDKYKLKQYHAESVKPLRDRLAGKESAEPKETPTPMQQRMEQTMKDFEASPLANYPAQPTQPREEERKNWDEFHACFTGDCPHEDVNNCIAELRKAATEAGRESAQPVKSEELDKASNEFLRKLKISPDNVLRETTLAGDSFCEGWKERAARGPQGDVGALVEALKFFEGKAIGEIVDGKISLLEYGETASKALTSFEAGKGTKG